MREYIANITSNKDRKVAADPGHEKLRLQLIREARWAKAKRNIREYIDEITGKREISKVILEAFDSEGKPPRHLSVEGLNDQYNRFFAQLRWATVTLEEFCHKMERLDPVRYAEYRNLQKQREEETKKKKEDAYQEYISGSLQDAHPQLREIIGRVLQKSPLARDLGEQLMRKTMDEREMHVIKAHQIGKSLGYLFADYIKHKNPDYALSDSQLYKAMELEAEKLEVIKAEIEAKLVALKELSLSAEAYLRQNQ